MIHDLPAPPRDSQIKRCDFFRLLRAFYQARDRASREGNQETACEAIRLGQWVARTAFSDDTRAKYFALYGLPPEGATWPLPRRPHP